MNEWIKKVNFFGKEIKSQWKYYYNMQSKVLVLYEWNYDVILSVMYTAEMS